MRIKNLLFIAILSPCLAAITITDDGVKTVTVVASLPTEKDFLETNKSSIFTHNPLEVVITLSGTYNGSSSSQYGALANAISSKTIFYNGRTAVAFTIDTTKVTGTGGSMFFVSGGTSAITFDTNTTVKFVAGSNIGKGVFYSSKYNSSDPNGNDQTGTFIFKQGLSVDTTGTTDGNGGTSYIFNLDQKSAKMYVNYNNGTSSTGSVFNASNVIQLTGDIYLNGSDAILGMNLSNSNSYLKGKEDYTAGSFNLGLTNGGKWVVTSGDVTINELLLTNTTDPNTNTDLNSTELTGGMSMIDIASQRMTTGFDTQRNINITTLKAGDNGVFRTMIDMANNKGDLVTIQKQETAGTTQNMYMQILQKGGYTLTSNVAITVAKIVEGGDNLTISSLPVNIGLYTYQPTITKERENQGYKWVIYQSVDQNNDDTKKDGEVQDSLKHWLSLQYRIYRIQTDSINRHIDELVPTFTKNNFWGNYFIGSQGKNKSRDDYQTFQFGYDWGMNAPNIRHFGGGFFDFTKMRNYDTDYDGQVNSFGLGAYYQISIQMNKRSTLDADAKMKYAYSSNDFYGKNNLANADFVKSYHLFYMGGRLGSKIDLTRRREWFIEPSAEFGVGFMSGGKINMVDTLTQQNFGASQKAATFLSARANLAVGKRFVKGNNYLDLRFKTYYAFDNNTGGDITLIDVDPTNQILYQTVPDNRWGIGIDANYAYTESFKLYASLERTFFSNYNTIYLFYLGFRVSLDDLFSGSIFHIFSGNGSRSSQRVIRHPKGKVIFGNNARPLPKLIEE